MLIPDTRFNILTISQLYANNSDGTIDMEEIEKTSAKIIYARE